MPRRAKELPKDPNAPWKTWAFTINNYDDGDIEWVKSMQVDCSRVTASKEVADTGTPHIQACMTFKRTMRFTRLKTLHKRAHWAMAFADYHANVYCKKRDSELIIDYIDSKPGKRTDLEKAYEAIEAGMSGRDFFKTRPSYQALKVFEMRHMYAEEPPFRKPIVYWLYGPTGVGKSRWAFTTFQDRYKAQKNSKWWTGYDGQEAIIIDELRESWCSLPFMLGLIDGNPNLLETKGGHVWVHPKYWIITSDRHPREFWQDDGAEQQLIRRITHVVNCSFGVPGDLPSPEPPPRGGEWRDSGLNILKVCLKVSRN